MNELKGKIALITGVGRKEGIGAAICREFAKQGTDIFYTYWRDYDKSQFPETASYKPEDFVQELEACGVRAQSVEMDLSKPESTTMLFEVVRQRLGEPDILINNACFDSEVAFLELTAESLDKHYAVNIRAITFLCQEFVRGWQKKEGGRVVIMTSGQSLGSMGGHKIPYTITKACAEMLASQLAPELLAKGITINAVDPGPTDTGWMTEALKKQIQKESSKGSLNTPVDTAKFIATLLIDKAEPTGQVIHAPR